MTGWGRWGDDDERGAANRIDAGTVLAAVGEVREGLALSLAAPIVGGRGFGLVGRADPVHLMVRDGGDYAAGLRERGGFGFSDDVLTLPTHGVSHLDALSHLWQDNLMYNGVAATEVTSIGARRLGIENVGPLVTRGVFVDAATAAPRSPDDPIHLAELQQLLADVHVELRAGDGLLIRTGWLDAYGSGTADAHSWPGLHADCAPWLADVGVSVIGADNPGVEVFPSGDPDCQVPIHVALLRGEGIYLAELLDLSALVGRARATFLFAVAPLPIVGGVGSPIVPIAIL